MKQLLGEKMTSAQNAMRIGLGFDAHGFDTNRKLILAGVEFSGPGLAGYSDADLVCHAAADAVLGAAGMPDIGQLFPDTDPQYKGISSLKLLAQVGEKLAAAGWTLGSLDIVLAAEKPKISDHLPQMRANLADALGAQPSQISIKGKTTEGLGFVGRHEGIACWAVCLIQQV
jgi:2-C-methyl-D-erythritol 2,4-cyclodiphosphate synthase